MLLGSLVTALVVAVQAMLTTSSSVFEISEVETVLINASDQVDRAEQRCDYTDAVEAAALAEGWPADAVTVSVELLVDNTGAPAADWIPQTCDTAVSAFDVQRLTITATHPRIDVVRTRIVVKSEVE